MKRFILLTIFLFLICSPAFSDTASLQSADGSAISSSNPLPITIIGGGGSGSGTVSSGTAGYFTYYAATGTTVDDQSIVYTDGTNIGIGTTSLTDKLEVNGNATVSGTLTANAFSTTAVAQPALTLDASTSGDTDYWISDCADSGGTSNDPLQVGLGLTKCTGTVFSMATDGGITTGDGTDTSIVNKYDLGGSSSYDPTWTYNSAGSSVGYITLTNLGASSDNSTRNAFKITSTFSGASSGSALKIGLFNDFNDANANQYSVGYGIYAKDTMTASSGTAAVSYSLFAYGDHTGAGTAAEFDAGYFKKAAITAGAITYNYAATFEGRTKYIVDAQTIADNGGGTAATLTLNPGTGYVELTCNDTDGCDITMGETGVQEGTPVTIVNVSANACNFADTSGVSELTGAIALGQYDTLDLIYIGDRWVERGTSNN